MVELITHGTPNIVCIQPFACLPNHVVGKGVIKALRAAIPAQTLSLSTMTRRERSEPAQPQSS